MSEQPSPLPRAYLTAVAAVLLIGFIALAVAINHVAGTGSPAAVAGATATPVPTPTAPPTPTVAASPTPGVTSTPCHTATFASTPLAPLGEPHPDIHHYTAPPPFQIDLGKLYEVRIVVSHGAADPRPVAQRTITLCLEPALAPNTVNNFVALARNHFYDGLTWHRVVAGFVIQGGDPTGTGNGGPGYQFKDEPVKGEYSLGCVAMANSGPNTNGSQFFICIANDAASLQKNYNLFGDVENGIAVAETVQKGDLMQTVTVYAQR